jgi:hypothetical protein
MGVTGNLRTLRGQSSTAGSRTIGSILANSSGSGAGAFSRIYLWYTSRGMRQQFYNDIVFSMRK